MKKITKNSHEHIPTDCSSFVAIYQFPQCWSVCDVKEWDDEWVSIMNIILCRDIQKLVSVFVWVDGIANDLGTVGSVAAVDRSRVFGHKNGRIDGCAVHNITLHSQRSMNPTGFARTSCWLLDTHRIAHRECACVYGDVDGVRNTYLSVFPLHLYSIWFTLRDKNYRLFCWFERFIFIFPLLIHTYTRWKIRRRKTVIWFLFSFNEVEHCWCFLHLKRFVHEFRSRTKFRKFKNCSGIIDK